MADSCVAMELDPEERGCILSQDITGQGGLAWDLKKNEKYGRYMVALRDIYPGDCILEELPLAYGPDRYNSVLVCAGCTRHVDESSWCAECRWPVCSSSCPGLGLHRQLECSLLARRGDRLSNSPPDSSLQSCILTARILLLKNHNQDAWRRIHMLEPLLEQWRAKAGWLEEEMSIVSMVRDQLGLSTTTTTEEILKISAICNTNTFSKYIDPGAEPGSSFRPVGTKARVVYLLSAMMSHACTPNAEQAISNISCGLKLSLRATRKICAGEQIQISYTELLEPTIIRQYNLLNSKLFACSCTRCLDPTELGTECGTISCLTCFKRGRSPPGQIRPKSNELGVWVCSLCQEESSGRKVRNLLLRIQQELEELLSSPDSSVQGYERYLLKYGRVLHPAHGFLLRLKYQLCGMYGRLPGYDLQELEEAGLRRKLELCEDLLTVLNVLQPGHTARRGIILYELHIVLLVLGRSQLGRDTAATAKANLRRSLTSLRECLAILQNEPLGTFAAQIYAGARESEPQLEKFFAAALDN